jgi:hypothetical protein
LALSSPARTTAARRILCKHSFNKGVGDNSGKINIGEINYNVLPNLDLNGRERCFWR